MGTLAINAGDDRTACRFRPAIARLAPGAPIVVMLHGFRYCPSVAATDPHRHILSDSPETDHWKAVSWPAKLGLAGADGLGIGFGWSARGTIWRAYRQASAAGEELAMLLHQVSALAPGHPLHLITHSLGARVALKAMATAPGIVRRAVLISPACFRAEATQMAPDALRGTEVFSILGRENTAYDLMLRAMMPHRGATLGRGGPQDPRWLDIRLGAPHVLAALNGLGHNIAPPRARICHWSGYVRSGVWSVYRALIHRPTETPMPLLRAQLTVDPARHKDRDMDFTLRPGAPV